MEKRTKCVHIFPSVISESVLAMLPSPEILTVSSKHDTIRVLCSQSIDRKNRLANGAARRNGFIPCYAYACSMALRSRGVRKEESKIFPASPGRKGSTHRDRLAPRVFPVTWMNQAVPST